MKKAMISVTQAARNFADCVNRVHYQQMTFILLKNGKPLARLVPESDRICTGRDLAKAVAEVELSSEDAQAWHQDLTSARRKLAAPKNKWR